MSDDRKPGIYAEDPSAPGGERQVKLTYSITGKDFKVISVKDDQPYVKEYSNTMQPAELKLTGSFDGNKEEILDAMLKAERIITGAQFAVWHRGKLFGCYAVDTKADAIQAARDEFLVLLGSTTRNARRLADKAARNFKAVPIS